MSNPINTIPIQQFLQLVKSAELGQQKEIRMDLKSARLLALCLAEVNSKLLEDYDMLFSKLMQSSGQAVTIQMDGGGFR
jgi:hypothetical protein